MLLFAERCKTHVFSVGCRIFSDDQQNEVRIEEVKTWYDGFVFGETSEIYNPWSVINYLDKKRVSPYWVNTSSNRLIGKLLREGKPDVKQELEELLCGRRLIAELDEQIVYDQLDQDEHAIWSLLLASGYLKASHCEIIADEYGGWKQVYTLELTNFEVKVMFRNMIRGWFSRVTSEYNDFVKVLLADDLRAMNMYLNRVTIEMFSYFDTGKKASRGEPEKFYHGFVLGLMVELADRYVIMSNRESGVGRYDVMLEPRSKEDKAIILEFKVQDTEYGEEKDLPETVCAALEQIEKKNYAVSLIAKGIPEGRIRKYGFAFCGKKVLIGSGDKALES